MSKTTAKKALEKVDELVTGRILSENIENIFSDRFARYSKYIIQDRAIPDARDGLKPVQRRILFAMYRLGLFANKPYKKSARVVGDVIGKYHPHGDTSVYEALVRLSQDFKCRLPLIDIHGNNGSIDGDPAAAMRYTEARLSKYAEFMLQDINKRTVGFVPNFDDEELEPTVLPSKFPNLLVNGTTGISAGYATDIPPHNVDEIMTAAIYRINNPNCSLDDIMKIVQGPDFPTGGIVQGIEGIRHAYESGKGKIIVKSKTEIVEAEKCNQIIITEIPYDVNKSALVKKMSEVYVAKGVDGILEIRDESDKEGLRIAIDISKTANAEFIRNFFFKTTDLQINYSFNMVCICNKRPMTLGIIDLLDAYIAHQKEVITNRSNFELATAKKRLHIVDGLIEMVSILDAVIKTIRSSANKKDAKENLISIYRFSEEQAEAIVTLQLYRLTNTDIFALQQEKEDLEKQIEELKEILSNEKILMDTIKKELMQTLKQISSPRKTVIEHKIDDVNVVTTELIAKEDTMIILTNDGYIKRISPKNYNSGEETKLKDNDVITSIYNSSTTDTLLLFTNLGNYVFLPVNKIPEVKHKDLGYNVSTLAKIDVNERIIFSVSVANFDDERYLLFATKKGLIKRTLIKELYATRVSKALKATKIRSGDELISVDITSSKKAEIVVVTKFGYMNRYDADEVSIMAPESFGVKSIELKESIKDEVATAHYVSSKDILVLLTSKGVIKRFRPDEINKGRKNNVGKTYIDLTRGNHFIFGDIIHRKNANMDLDCYLYGSSGHFALDYGMLKSSKASSDKKIQPTPIGNPERIVIVRNNNDLE